MKIGTDGVLLGAWCPIDNNPFSVLDIGAGTGILSLMLAQRSYAEQIDSLEIDEEAYEQCVENFENSPWSDRLFCFHAGLDEFVDEPEDEYDIIISNPPFYSEDFKTKLRKSSYFHNIGTEFARGSQGSISLATVQSAPAPKVSNSL
jgi:tRNA1Val (adenine37-N6)-methyltransferase